MHGFSIRNSISKVLREWQCQLQPHASAESGFILEKSMPSFLDSLADDLENHQINMKLFDLDCERSPQLLPRILQEYSTLRKVLTRIAEQDGLDLESLKLIDEKIDQAMVQTSQMLSSRSATNQVEPSEMEKFAAIAAHDLRSPVATMAGYVNFLKEEIQDPPEVVSQSLDFISSASKRMLTLIERLLDYSRIGQESLQKQSVDLNQVLTNTLANLEALIEDSNAQISCGPLPMVQGDEALLGQLFQNLISNSIKFCECDQPEIHIHLCGENQSHWTFCIEDNGIGFDPEQAATIFEPFKRLHSKSEYQGSGLGLSTCRRVVELHGGRIWCDGKPGEGSVFYFTLQKLETEAGS